MVRRVLKTVSTRGTNIDGDTRQTAKENYLSHQEETQSLYEAKDLKG